MIDYDINNQVKNYYYEVTYENQFRHGQYEIIASFCSTFYEEISGVLILDNESNKYNAYLMIFFENNATYIVKNYIPQSLDVAQILFPLIHIDENNYGF